MDDALIRDDAVVRGWRDPLAGGGDHMVLTGPGWTSQPVPGRVVEAAFATPDGGALVLTSDDRPHRDRVHAVWLGADGRLRGRSDLGLPRQPGTVSQVALAPPDGVSFCFPHPGMRWQVRPRPRGGALAWIMRRLGRLPLALARAA